MLHAQGIAPVIEAGGGILLYHAVFDTVPAALTGGLHNVRPEIMHAQLRALRDAGLDFVSLDDWLSRSGSQRDGLVAVTFDDAYACVFTHGWPVLRTLEIPATIFINGCTLAGQTFWRDKIRAVIAVGLVEAFQNSLADGHPLKTIAPKRFYRASKDPALYSGQVDAALDAFLAQQGITLDTHCITSPDQVVRDPLLTYGNHTFSHYVLASLDPVAQANEITRNAKVLAALNVPLTRAFALPFGGPETFNDATVSALQAHGATAALLAGNGTWRAYQDNPAMTQAYPLATAARFMPSDTLPA